MAGSSLHIAGIMRLHRFEESIELVLKSLSDVCTGLYLLTDNVVSERIQKAILTTPKIQRIQKCPTPWTQAGSLDAAMRMLDDVKPDIVLLPDEDELLPERLPGEIDKWRSVWDKRPSIRFPVVHCIESPYRILAERLDLHSPHCKAIRWSPGISYLDGYAGWCFPSSHYRQKKYTCSYPLRHLAFMTEAQRKMRMRAHRHGNPWYNRKTFPTMEYNPDMTWDQWNNIAGPYLVKRTFDEAAKLRTIWDLLRLLRVCHRPESAEALVRAGSIRIGIRSETYKRVASLHSPLPVYKCGDEIIVWCGRRAGRLRIVE